MRCEEFGRRGSAWLLALAVACGGGGSGDDDGAADSGTGSGPGSSEGAGSGDESSEGGGASGVCTAFSTVNTKGDVFVPEGAGSAGACSMDPSPCAGVTAGEWVLDASCGYDLTPLTNPWVGPCPGASFSAQPPVRTGTLSIEEDGRYNLSMATSHTYEFGADVTCLGVFDCSMAGGVLAQQGGSPSCVGDAFSCQCTVTGLLRDPVQITGQLELEHASWIVRDAPGEVPHPLCAADDRLDIWTVLGPGVPMGGNCLTDADCTADGDGQFVLCMPQ
jgi:hypothetical protein